MKKLLSVICLILAGIFIFYLLLPTPSYPVPPADALQSKEPADTETPLRRAYFTNLTRQEVLEHHLRQFKSSYGINLPTYRLNYPPEESATLIRDQTRSTFLEEIVHPFRESLYVNGFEPKEAKDAIEIEGKPWRQKIIVRYVPSHLLVRAVIAVSTLALLLILIKEYLYAFKDLKKA